MRDAKRQIKPDSMHFQNQAFFPLSDEFNLKEKRHQGFGIDPLLIFHIGIWFTKTSLKNLGKFKLNSSGRTPETISSSYKLKSMRLTSLKC